MDDLTVKTTQELAKAIYNTPVVFSIPLANLFGPEAALVLQQTHYKTTFFSQKEDNRINGHFWYRHSYADWHREYPFWSAATFKLAIAKLEKAEILVAEQLSQNKFDKGKWYRINYERLQEFFPSKDVKLFFDGNLAANRLDENSQSNSAKNANPVVANDQPLAISDPSAGTPLPIEPSAPRQSKSKNQFNQTQVADSVIETHPLDSQKMDGLTIPSPHPAQNLASGVADAETRSEGRGKNESSNSGNVENFEKPATPAENGEETVNHEEAKNLAREIHRRGPLRGLVEFCVQPQLSGITPGPREWKRHRKLLNDVEAMTPADVKLTSDLFAIDFRLWWYMYGPGQDGEPLHVPEYLLTVWPRFLMHHRKNQNWVFEFGSRTPGWLKLCREDPATFVEYYAHKNRNKPFRPGGNTESSEVTLYRPTPEDEDAILEAMIREATGGD